MVMVNKMYIDMVENIFKQISFLEKTRSLTKRISSLGDKHRALRKRIEAGEKGLIRKHDKLVTQKLALIKKWEKYDQKFKTGGSTSNIL